MEPKTFHVYGTRPQVIPFGNVQIPADWLIFNAPRPLDASCICLPNNQDVYLAWQGDFLHGRFFAAVNPEDHRAIEENRLNDGWILQYHSDEEIKAWGVEYLKKYNVDPGDFTFQDIKQSFFLHINKD